MSATPIQQEGLEQTREEETFYLQQGSLAVHVSNMTLNASPGDIVQLPRGVVHCFQNNGDVDAEFLLLTAPAGLEAGRS